MMGCLTESVLDLEWRGGVRGFSGSFGVDRPHAELVVFALGDLVNASSRVLARRHLNPVLTLIKFKNGEILKLAQATLMYLTVSVGDNPLFPFVERFLAPAA